MAKAKKQAPRAVIPGPRIFCIWRGDPERMNYALVWQDRDPLSGQPVAVHALYVDQTPMVVHTRHQPSAIVHMEPTMLDAARNNVAEYTKHLKWALLAWGGSADAFELLGIQKPIITAPEGASVQSDGGDPAKRRELIDLYARASRLLGVPLDELSKKYQHLNPGLQAMNLRNRLRGKGHNV